MCLFLFVQLGYFNNISFVRPRPTSRWEKPGIPGKPMTIRVFWLLTFPPMFGEEVPVWYRDALCSYRRANMSTYEQSPPLGWFQHFWFVMCQLVQDLVALRSFVFLFLVLGFRNTHFNSNAANMFLSGNYMVLFRCLGLYPIPNELPILCVMHTRLKLIGKYNLKDGQCNTPVIVNIGSSFCIEGIVRFGHLYRWAD